MLQGRRPYFVIAALAFLVYFPILFFGFTYLDDNNLIIDHAGFLGNFLNIFESFRHDVFLSAVSQAYYRPIMTISLILDAQIGGISPLIYHLTDLLIHILSASLVFVLLRKLNYRKDLSFLSALLFAVHPVLTQAVAWVPGRNDTLLTVFVLLSFISLINFLDSKNNKYLKWYFLWFILAVFTKETAIMMIPIQWFYVQYIRTEKYYLVFWKKITIGWAGVVGMFFLMRHFAFPSPISFGLGNIIKSVFNNSPAFVQFVGKIMFPFNLSTYPIIEDTTFVYGIVAILLVLIALFATKNKRYAYIIFGASWFLFFLAPTFVRPNADIVADFIEHRLYLPIIGFFILLLETSWVQKFSISKKISILISLFILLIFCTITVIHGQNFKNRLSFWNDATVHSPHAPLAHRNLGAMLFLNGRMDEAKPEFEKSLELNPEEQMAHNNLGLIYMNKGEFEKAEKEYDEELKINPYYDNAYANRGILYYKMGRFDEAVDSWKKTLEINSGYSEALYNLFGYYYQRQDKENATFWARKAQENGMPLLPEMKQLINPLGSILAPEK